MDVYFFCCKRQFIAPDTHFGSKVNNFKSFVNINTDSSPRLQPPFIGNAAIILWHIPKMSIMSNNRRCQTLYVRLWINSVLFIYFMMPQWKCMVLLTKTHLYHLCRPLLSVKAGVVSRSLWTLISCVLLIRNGLQHFSPTSISKDH